MKIKQTFTALLIIYLSVFSIPSSAWPSKDVLKQDDFAPWYCSAISLVSEQKSDKEEKPPEEEEEPDCD